MWHRLSVGWKSGFELLVCPRQLSTPEPFSLSCRSGVGPRARSTAEERLHTTRRAQLESERTCDLIVAAAEDGAATGNCVAIHTGDIMTS